MLMRTCIVMVCSVCVATSAFADVRMDAACLAAQIERQAEIEKAVEERQMYGIQEDGTFVPLPEHLRKGAPASLNARSIIWDLGMIVQVSRQTQGSRQIQVSQQMILATLSRIDKECGDYSEKHLDQMLTLLGKLKRFAENRENYEWVRLYANELFHKIQMVLSDRADTGQFVFAPDESIQPIIEILEEVLTPDGDRKKLSYALQTMLDEYATYRKEKLVYVRTLIEKLKIFIGEQPGIAWGSNKYIDYDRVLDNIDNAIAQQERLAAMKSMGRDHLSNEQMIYQSS